MSNLDVLFVNPGAQAELYQGLASTLTAIEPPLWAGMLATFVRDNGYSVQILDANAEQLDPWATAARITALDPLLVAVVVYGHNPSASTQNMLGASQVCRQTKAIAPTLPIVMIGGHISALPERTLRDEAVDFVCQGEGPHTLIGLLEHLASPSTVGLSGVPGLWYFENGKLNANASAPIVADLDSEFPSVAWDLLPMELYRAHNWHCFPDLNRQPYASIYTTLGCPYKCTFCCINAPFRLTADRPSSYRFRGAKQVLDELELLSRRYGVRNLKIADEMFVLKEDHVFAICDGIVERGLDFNIWAYARVDTVKNHFLERLKRAGVTWLGLGIESGSKYVRDGVEKGRFGGEQIVEVVHKIEATGIHVAGNYIFGLPDDDLDSMQETLDLALELKTDFANFYSAMAYPGSRLYDMAVANGWRLPQRWSGFSQHALDTLPLPTKTLSAADVLGFRDHAFQTYFNDPGYLAKLTVRFGPAIVQQVRNMAAIPLARLYTDEAAVRALPVPMRLSA